MEEKPFVEALRTIRVGRTTGIDKLLPKSGCKRGRVIRPGAPLERADQTEQFIVVPVVDQIPEGVPRVLVQLRGFRRSLEDGTDHGHSGEGSISLKDAGPELFPDQDARKWVAAEPLLRHAGIGSEPKSQFELRIRRGCSTAQATAKTVQARLPG